MPDFDPVAAILSVPAIIALTNLAKSLGLQGKLSALVAVVLGVALASADYVLGDSGLWRAASDGLLLGLAAAGLYDLTPGGEAPRRALIEEA